jgi:hypothetical protein
MYLVASLFLAGDAAVGRLMIVVQCYFLCRQSWLSSGRGDESLWCHNKYNAQLMPYVPGVHALVQRRLVDFASASPLPQRRHMLCGDFARSEGHFSPDSSQGCHLGNHSENEARPGISEQVGEAHPKLRLLCVRDT